LKSSSIGSDRCEWWWSTERSSWFGHQSLFVLGCPRFGVGAGIAGFSFSLTLLVLSLSGTSIYLLSGRPSLRMSLLLTLGTQTPENHLRLLDDKSMIGGWVQTGSRANCAVHIGSQTAAATDNVMVVVSHPRLIASRMAGRLDASDEAGLFQDVEIVVHGLGRERAEALAGGVCNGFRIPMLSLAQDRHEDGESGCGHPQTGPAKGFVKGGFVGRHINHYRIIFWNESIVQNTPFGTRAVSRFCEYVAGISRSVSKPIERHPFLCHPI
jgi:hypothetical protein